MSQALTDSWEQGDPYERYIGRWSRLVAPLFLDWLDVPAGRDWLDIGCGTGALSAAVLKQSRPRAVTAIEPSDGFRQTAERLLAGHATILAGSAANVPLPEASVDAVVSGLVFNFIPDQAEALREMTRVCRPGGTVAAYVWDYASGMQFLRIFWDAATALDPAAAQLDEGNRFPICREGTLGDLWTRHGFAAVSSRAIEVPTTFADFDDLWQPFLGGQGPAPSYVASLEPRARNELADLVRSSLTPAEDGSLRLQARAWAVRGLVP